MYILYKLKAVTKTLHYKSYTSKIKTASGSLNMIKNVPMFLSAAHVCNISRACYLLFTRPTELSCSPSNVLVAYQNQ